MATRVNCPLAAAPSLRPFRLLLRAIMTFRATLLVVAVTALLCPALHGQSPERPRLILDADTANEIDDLFAIVRMLHQQRFNVIGLSSAQWFHYLGDPDSVAASQRDNETMLKLMGRQDLPAPKGSNEPMGKPWGGDEAKDSAAAIHHRARQGNGPRRIPDRRLHGCFNQSCVRDQVGSRDRTSNQGLPLGFSIRHGVERME